MTGTDGGAAASIAGTSATDAVSVRRVGATWQVNLAGPAPWQSALGSLPDAVRALLRSVPADPQIYGMLFQATGDGGQAAPMAPSTAVSLRQRFLDIWLVDRFPKPTVFAIDGPISGMAASLALAGTHRVALEGFSLQFAGVARGALPEAGTLVRLRRLGMIGRYLALTGVAVDAVDAWRYGLATHVTSRQEMLQVASRYADAETIDGLLDALPVPAASALQASPLAAVAEAIDTCFSAVSLEAVVERLAGLVGPHGEWAARTLATLQRQPPLALAVTWQLLHGGGDSETTLQREFAVGTALAAHQTTPGSDQNPANMVNEVLRQSHSERIDFPRLQSEPEPMA